MEKIPLKDDEEGKVNATLLKFISPNNNNKAVLYLHGYCDYFFHQHVANKFLSKGYDFYALELRKYGRSWEEYQKFNYVEDVREYYEELDFAINLIRERDHHDYVLFYAHSTGGLIASLYCEDRKNANLIDALILNSPFFEYYLPAYLKIVVSFFSFLGKYFPNKILSLDDFMGKVYRQSIHVNYHGEWNYNEKYKPYNGTPVYLGWVRAIRNAHRRFHKGLSIHIPILVMHSDKSQIKKKWSDDTMYTDIVLNVAHMKKYAHLLGDNVSIYEVRGGMHDLALSQSLVRDDFFFNLFKWLDQVQRK
ncbi:MAG: alpha/beta hydrolase [Bacteroidales bacterium]